MKKVGKLVKYSDKVKQASAIHTAIESLKDEERLRFAYRDEVYEIKAYSTYGNKLSYSVWNAFRGMNVDKVGKTALTLYTFDMMQQRTTYRMSLLDATILPETVSVTA